MATVTLGILGDTRAEPDETITISRSNISLAGSGVFTWSVADVTRTLTIVDDDSPPGAPTGLSATAGDRQVALAWTDPNDASITGWEVRQTTRTNWRRTDAWTVIAGSSATTTRHTVTNLNNGTLYRFQVRAVNANGGSPASNEATATPMAMAMVPGVMVSGSPLTVDEGDSNGGTYTVVLATQPSAAVTVTPSSNNADVEFTPATLSFSTSSGSGGWDTAQTVTVTADVDADADNDSATLTHSITGGDYATVNVPDVSVTVTDTTPGQPTGLTATAGDAQVELSWSAPVSGGSIGSWQYRATTETSGWSGASWMAIAGSDSTTTRHTVESLTNNSTYRFQVRAVGSVGTANYGVASAEARATPVAALPELTLSGTADGTEGGSLSLSLSSDIDVGGTLAVSFSVQGSTSATDRDAAAADFNGGTLSGVTTASFNNGKTAMVSLRLTDDASVEGDEGFRISLVAGTGYTVASGSAVLSGTLTDNDGIRLTAETSKGATEGGSLSVALSAVATSDGGTTYSTDTDFGSTLSGLSWSYSGGDAVAGDFVTVPSSASFSDGTASVDFVVKNDSDSEESYSIQLSAVTGHTVVGSNAVSGKLGAMLTFVFGSATATVTEGDVVSLAVNVSPTPVENITVFIDTTDGTAESPADYTSGGYSLGFSAGVSTSDLFIQSAEDTLVEGDEAFTAMLTGSDYPAIAIIGDPNTVTVTIEDDDTAPGVRLSATTLTVDEGDSAGGTYTVVLATQPDADVTVTVSSAALGDVTVSGSPLTFTSGTGGNWNMAQTVTVTAAVDSDTDNDSVTLTHSVSGGATGYGGGLSIDSVAVTVTDTTPGAAASLSAVAGDAQVTLTWGLPVSGGTRASWQYRQKAGSNAYGAWTPVPSSNAGTTSYTVSGLTNDTEYRFQVRAVGSVGTDNVGAASAEASATPRAAPVAGVTVNPQSLTVDEGDSNGGTYTVVLATQPSAVVMVTPSSNNADVTFSPATLTFATGTGGGGWATAQTVTVTADVDVDADNDSATLTHGITGGDYASVDVPDVRVTVTDTTPELTLETAPSAVAEGTAISVTVTSDKNVSGTLAVSLTLADRGSSGFTADDIMGALTQTFTTASFGGGKTAAVTIATVNDAIVEGAETYTITLGSGTGYALGDDVAVDGTLNDNDSAQVTLASGTIAVTEGQTLTVPVTLSAAADTVVNGRVTLSSGTPTDDFAAAMVNFSIAASQTSGNAVFLPKTANNGDSTYNAPRSYTATVTLTTPPVGVTVGSDATDTVRVTDNTAAPSPGVRLSETTLTVDEGDATGDSYTVVLNTQPSAAVTVTVAGFGGTDVRATPALLTFGTGTGPGGWATAQTVTVTAVEDSDADDEAAVTLTHAASGATGYGGGLSIASVAVTVTDTTPVLTLPEDPQTVQEGTNIILDIRSDKAVSGTLDVSLTLSDRGASNFAAADITGALTQTFTTTSFRGGMTAIVSIATVNDAIVEGAETYTVTLGTGTGYVVGSDSTADGTLNDDDRARLTLASTEAIAVTEGQSLTVPVTMSAAVDTVVNGRVTLTGVGGSTPTADFALAMVDFSISAGNTSASVVFLAKTADAGDGNYNAARSYTATLTLMDPPDDVFRGSDRTDTVTVTDNSSPPTPGVTLNRSSLTVTEEDTTGVSYTVVLNTAPTGDVTVTVSSAAIGDVTATPATLTFGTGTGPGGWSTAQSVKVTAGDDSDADNDSVTLTHTASSSDTAYEGVSINSVMVTVTDNDTAGVTVSPRSLTVDEGDTTGTTYTVVLNTRPSAAVTVTPSSNNADVKFMPSTLSFATSSGGGGWDTAQTVRVTAVSDADADNDSAMLTHGITGGNYATVNVPDVRVTVTDTTPELTLETNPSAVSEGTAIRVTVSSDKAVSGTLSVRLTLADRGSSGFDENDVTGALTQTVTTASFGGGTTAVATIATVNDAIVEGAETYSITLGSGTGYVVGDSVTVNGTLNDNDSAEVTLDSGTIAVTEGQTLTVPVTLSMAADTVVNGRVTLTGVSGSTPTEDFSAAMVNFSIRVGQTSANASFAGQTPDGEYNAARSYTATVTLRSPPAGVTVGTDNTDTVTVTDNSPAPGPGVTLNRASLTVTEEDTTGAVYTVVLNTAPTGDVTVTVSSAAIGDVTATPSMLIFGTDTGSGGWDTAQSVTVTAGDDSDADNDSVTLTHTASSDDNNYEGVTINSVMVTVTDNDTRGVTVSGSPLTVSEGDPTGVSYTVVLDTRPSAAVTVTPSSNNADLRFMPATLTFGTGTGIGGWDTAQSVTVTAVADSDTTDDNATLTHGITGGDYATVNVPDVRVTVTDTTPTLMLATDPAAVTEGGTISLTLSSDKNVTGTLRVRLTLTDRGTSGFGATDIPGAVTQTLTTSDFGGGTTAMVSIPTRDDSIVEGTERYRITLNAGTGYAVGGDAEADGILNDNDNAQVTLGSTIIEVTEGQSLTVPVTMSGAADTVVNGKVTLSTGIPTDDFVSAEASFRIAVGQMRANAVFMPKSAPAGDGDYNAARSYTATVTLETPPTGVTVGSDDTDTVRVNDNTPSSDPGITLSRSTLPVTEGASGSYTVRLNTRPSAAVMVTVGGFVGSGVRVSLETLSFTTDTWNTAQTVTVTAAADDNSANESVTLTHTASSSDNNYNGAMINSVTVTVTDSDRPGVTLSETRLALREGGTAGSYTVVLDSEPSAEVTVMVAGFTGTSVMANPATLSFAANVWDTAQTVMVTAGQDVDTMDENVTLTHSASGATGYGSALSIAGVAVRVSDDDRPAGVSLSVSELTVSEGSTGNYTVVLDSEPSAAVTVTVAGFAGSDVRASPATLSFAPGTWDTEQTVTVTAGQDADIMDDNVTLTHSASGATGYTSALSIGDVVVTVTDDDVADVVEGPSAASRQRQAEQQVLARVADTLLAGSITILSSRIDAANSGAPPTTTLRLGGQSSLHAALRALQPSLQSGTLHAAQLLGRSAFVLPLSAVAGGGSGTALDSLALWGSGDYRRLSGTLQNPDDPATTLDWESSVTSVWVGADLRPHRQWLTGLALSWSQAPFSTRQAGLDQDSRLFGVHPYLSWNTANGRGQLWLSAGYGWGELRPEKDTPGARRDSRLASVSLGGNATLLSSNRLLPGGSSQLRIKAHGALAEFDVDSNATVRALSVIVRQLRFALEGRHQHTLSGGALLSPSVELALRHDHSDAVEGGGMEVGGALRYSEPTLGLTLEGRGWVLATHREEDRREWGVSGLLHLDPGTERRGLALSLVPRHGPSQRTDLDRLLDPGATPVTNPAPGQLGLEAELGYGYGLAAHRGVLVPFVGTTLDGLHRAYRFGSRLQFGSGLSLDLEGQREEQAQRPIRHNILLHGTLHW